MDNLVLEDGDPGALRVVRDLDLVAQLNGFETLQEGRALSFQWAFHLVLLVDSLDQGNYAPVWREDVISAFAAFKQDVANAQLQYRQTHESRLHYERFGRLLSGSGSDTADVIRVRHSFLLSEVYCKIRLNALDPNRRFDPLAREVIWNRDRGVCQNPSCERPERRVPFNDAEIHHVVEHVAGGSTVLENGILICPECHAKRAEMQRLAPHFQEYLKRIYTNPAQRPVAGIAGGFRNSSVDGQPETERDADENNPRAPGARLKIVIDWGSLDVDRETQMISGGQASELIVKLLLELIGAFGKPMEQQLTELPIIRFPLSRNPSIDFLNASTGVPFSFIRLPGSDLHFCPHSGTREKLRRLKELFSRLTLPDGNGFPEGSVECSIETHPL
jgi:5-methylcytosine-specific restriction endonuclease McrA